MTKRQKELQRLRNQIARMEAGREAAIKMLVKAEVQLPGLRKQAARLANALLKRENEIRRLSQLGPAKDEDEKATRRQLDAEVQAAAEPEPEDDIPAWLQRQPNKKDEEARAEILAQQEADKKRKAEVSAEKRQIKKEDLEAELTGKRRKMPLTGKAALDAIRKPQA